MGKGASPPDPYKTAAAQTGANKEAIETSAKVSAIDQYSPWGNTTFTRDPKTGVPTKQTISLGAGEQQFYDSSNQVRNALAGKAKDFTSFLPSDQFQPRPEGSGDKVAQALYDRRINLMKPQLKEADDSLRLNLSERGIPIGSEIYNNENNRLDRAREDTYAAAAQDAILAGGSEEDRQLNRDLTLRAQPFNEVSAFLQGAPSVPTPQFQNTPAYQMQAPDIAGLINNNYNQKQQQQGALSSGLFGLGSAAIGLMSDRRAKTDIKRIGTLDNGLPVYGFRYIEGAGPYQIGVMAQEVEDVLPEAVIKTPNGLRMVNYEMLAHSITGERSTVPAGAI